MTRIIIHGDEEVTFSSKAYGFYAYKNRRTREEILLYRLYQRDKKKGEECWILLSRVKERIETIKYILSSDFTSNFFQSAVIKGVFDDDSFHLLNFLMLLNGYNRMTLLDENKNPMVSLIAPIFNSHKDEQYWYVPLKDKEIYNGIDPDSLPKSIRKNYIELLSKMYLSTKGASMNNLDVWYDEFLDKLDDALDDDKIDDDTYDSLVEVLDNWAEKCGISNDFDDEDFQ